jgi:hypothetical protein
MREQTIAEVRRERRAQPAGSPPPPVLEPTGVIDRDMRHAPREGAGDLGRRRRKRSVRRTIQAYLEVVPSMRSPCVD